MIVVGTVCSKLTVQTWFTVDFWGQAGDVIGCYVSSTSALSFTRNGAELGSTPLPVGNYYPTSTSAPTFL
jgi:hypothetical protein